MHSSTGRSLSAAEEGGKQGTTGTMGTIPFLKARQTLTHSLTLHLSPMRHRPRSMALGDQESLHWPSLDLLAQGLDQGGLLSSQEPPCIPLHLENLPQDCLHIACLSAAAQPSSIKKPPSAS
ncbi:hypothetical protein CTAM01_04340 [Colletotrichum tamarilloi]|uniref:Uncharacterized protein n=1 Tax=Colletotrichum tamarilloi TaxID=1209934 RepID=A0ABQ9RI56_9PEZI|nr:uncharacterized protein CTAM01_04340 [Colletotrichum tamarilloi]KAI3551015.1 hypothetical protein CSPX01_01510 [Colletotrichum filicis]KAK1504110.1 hypothetical protein CTAM01_04340 [Colletotrichum tamarilloi]